MSKEIQSRLRAIIDERDQGQSELREEFDKSRTDDPAQSRENEHLKDSYVGEKAQGDDRSQEKTMVEQERSAPHLTPPRSTGSIQDRITHERNMALDNERAAQEKDQDREMDLGDEERSLDEER